MGNGMGLLIKLRGTLGLAEGVLIGFLREPSGMVSWASGQFRKLISRVANAVSHDISGRISDIPLYPGDLLEPRDVILL